MKIGSVRLTAARRAIQTVQTEAAVPAAIPATMIITAMDNWPLQIPTTPAPISTSAPNAASNVLDLRDPAIFVSTKIPKDTKAVMRILPAFPNDYASKVNCHAATHKTIHTSMLGWSILLIQPLDTPTILPTLIPTRQRYTMGLIADSSPGLTASNDFSWKFSLKVKIHWENRLFLSPRGFSFSLYIFFFFSFYFILKGDFLTLLLFGRSMFLLKWKE